MKDLIAMLDHKFPGASKSEFFRRNSLKWVRQWNELQKLRNRRPAIYEEAIIALVDWIGEHATTDNARLRKMRQSVTERSFWEDMGE